MNHLDLVRMSIENITVEMTESRTLSNLLGGDNKTVSLTSLEEMIIKAAMVAPAPSDREYDKVFMVLHFVNGESLDFRMDLTTKNNNLIVYINSRIKPK